MGEPSSQTQTDNLDTGRRRRRSWLRGNFERTREGTIGSTGLLIDRSSLTDSVNVSTRVLTDGCADPENISTRVLMDGPFVATNILTGLLMDGSGLADSDWKAILGDLQRPVILSTLRFEMVDKTNTRITRYSCRWPDQTWMSPWLPLLLQVLAMVGFPGGFW
jgi:hypothetical protein